MAATSTVSTQAKEITKAESTKAKSTKAKSTKAKSTKAKTIEAQQLLQEHFGWNEFKPGQQQVIQRLLDGRSALAVFPTGGGKSLCYQLPALALDGLTVVVSPLIALMKDQIQHLAEKGIVAVRLDSSLTLDEYRDAMQAIRNGTAKLLYVAPERFFNERFRSALEGVDISLFAIDEAHCISQWGHNFRPDYLKLALIAKGLKVDRVLCLTATATPAVQQDICDTFSIDSDDAITTEFFRPNLHLRSDVVDSDNHLPTLLDRLQSQEPGATIVYVTLQKTAESVAEACAAAGLDARPYHAGMKAEQRNEIQDWFMTGDNRIVVATIAFGMGIDKSDIRAVYHFNPPKSIENYAQEIGRAGRDGEVSQCVLLFNPQDVATLENFVYGDTPDEPSVRRFLEAIDQEPDEFFLSLFHLSRHTDIKSIVVKTLLTYLELEGFIQSTTARYDAYSFKPLVPSAKILANFSGERQSFVRKLLSCSRQSKTLFHLDLGEAIAKTGADRGRIVTALDYLAEQKWIDLRVAGLKHGYRKLKPLPPVDEFCTQVVERLNDRESGEIDRLRQVKELAAAATCQAAMLSEHFGQPLVEPCGTCTGCRSDSPLVIPSVEPSALPVDALNFIAGLRQEHDEILSTPRAAARFLCGLGSPRFTAAKLTRHQHFGCCEGIPFDFVMASMSDGA